MKCFVVAPWVFAALVAGSACGPEVDDGTGGDTSEPTSGAETTDAASTASSTGAPVTATNANQSSSGTGEPVDCDALTLDECDGFAECRHAFGPEATPEGEPGEYYCSDLNVPFACVSVDCEPGAGTVVLCNVDEPDVAVWVIDECVPLGWQPCPDGVCI